MKLVMTTAEFEEMLKSVKIPALSGRKIASVDIPGKYASRSDITIEFEEPEIHIPEPAPVSAWTPPTDDDEEIPY